MLDVADRIARILAGLPADEVTLAGPSVVVAEDLSPSMTATLPREHILGILLEGGLPDRACRDPRPGVRDPGGRCGARGAGGARLPRAPAPSVALDGAPARSSWRPTPTTVADFDARAARHARTRAADASEASLPAVTTDGVEVTLLANIGTPAEAAPARALGARGVGLFRTEFLFLERSTPPTEDEQAAAYREAVEAFGGDPVTIRLLDIGGDKPIPYLPMPAEENPFLGVRALRLAARPARAVRDPAAGVLPGGRGGAGEGDGADGRGRGRRDAAARPRGTGAGGAGGERASRSGPSTSA